MPLFKTIFRKEMLKRLFLRWRKLLLLLFILANINGLLNTLVILTSRLADGEKVYALHYFIYEFTGSYSFTLLIPIVLWVYSVYPIKKENKLIGIPLYFFLAVILGIIHTGIMYYSRLIIFHFAGWGEYNYGFMQYRLVMETLKLSVGFFVVYLIYNFYEVSKEKQAEKLKAVKLEEQLTRTRLEFLKNQIHPHFLFNTLNMISSVMYENVQEADRMIANLSDLLRTTLKTSGASIHTLSEEIKILKFYIEIMEARFKDKLETSYNVDSSVLTSMVPSFLLQPLVENSIKYGMENLSTVKIEIGAKKVDSRLSITIKDNGPGIHIEPEEVLKRGVGLSNTQERLEKLYGKDFEFTWQNIESGGLLIEITFPFIAGDNE